MNFPGCIWNHHPLIFLDANSAPLPSNQQAIFKETGREGLARFHRCNLLNSPKKRPLSATSWGFVNRPPKNMPEKTPNSQSYGMTWCQNSAFFAFIQAAPEKGSRPRSHKNRQFMRFPTDPVPKESQKKTLLWERRARNFTKNLLNQ